MVDPKHIAISDRLKHNLLILLTFWPIDKGIEKHPKLWKQNEILNK
jgi:hypothetical protein